MSSRWRSGRAYAFRVVLLSAGLWIVGPGSGDALAAAPVCNSNSYSVDNTATLPLPVTANCSDADNDPMVASVTAFPAHGQLYPDGNGGGVYYPNPGYVGPDSLSFHAEANTESSNDVTIFINVTGTAINQPPTCFSTTFTIQAFEGRRTTSTPCFDPDTPQNQIVGTILNPAGHGTAAINGTSFDYDADDEYIGPDSFSFKLNDGHSDSATVTVNVDVVDYPEGNQPPTCPETHVFVETGSSIRLTGNCVDPENDPISYAPGSPFTVNGSFSAPTSDSVLFTPTPSFVGLAQLNYTVRDQYHDPIQFNIPIDVIPVGTPCCETAPEATPQDPYAASVTSPVPGGIYIDTRPTSLPAPTGFTVLNQEYDIHAPDAVDAANPLVFVFKLDGAELAAQHVAPSAVRMIRNGDPVHTSCPAPEARTGDWWPCEQSRLDHSGDLWITVLTMQGSIWNIGATTAPPDADSDGVLDATDNCVNVANANQKDYDQNGRGDACDPVSPSGICKLTKSYVSGSAKYARLSANQKKATDRLATAVCDVIDDWTARLKPAQKKVVVAAYKVGVLGLEATGWLTHAQAVTLKGAADALP